MFGNISDALICTVPIRNQWFIIIFWWPGYYQKLFPLPLLENALLVTHCRQRNRQVKRYPLPGIINSKWSTPMKLQRSCLVFAFMTRVYILSTFQNQKSYGCTDVKFQDIRLNFFFYIVYSHRIINMHINMKNNCPVTVCLCRHRGYRSFVCVACWSMLIMHFSLNFLF